MVRWQAKDIFLLRGDISWECHVCGTLNNHMMTSSNGNIFRVTSPGIYRSPINSPNKGQWLRTLMISLTCAGINGWVNNRETGDLRRHHAHYDVIVMNETLMIRITTVKKDHMLFITLLSIQYIRVRWYQFSAHLNSLYNWNFCGNNKHQHILQMIKPVH